MGSHSVAFVTDRRLRQLRWWGKQQTVRFEFTNEGQSTHEFLIGDEADQAEFEEAMQADMDHGTDAGVSVDPGQTDSFEYTFDEAGELLAGCHEPGHYETGMVATITVTE